MVLVTSNKAKQLLTARFVGKVRRKEMERGREDFQRQLAELSPGFTVLGDVSQLDVMDRDCAPVLGRVMELCGKAGVSLVIRVVPDPTKDIGLNILTAFHYQRRPQIVTVSNITEAIEKLPGVPSA